MTQRVSFIVKLILVLDLIRKMAGGDINTAFWNEPISNGSGTQVMNT